MSYDPEQLHKDVEGRLNSIAFFQDITVIRFTPGVTFSNVEKAVSTLNVKGGKVGACIVLAPPEETAPDADTVGPDILVLLKVHVFTKAKMNLVGIGTGKSNAQIRREVRKALHHWIPNGTNAIYCDSNAGSPVEVSPEVETYELHFKLPLTEPFNIAHLPPPVIIGTPEAVSMTSMTNGAVNDAEIWYSLDGSFPSPLGAASARFGFVLLTESGIAVLSEAGNPLASANPISVPSGTTIRAAAYLDGYPGSSVAVKTIN